MLRYANISKQKVSGMVYEYCNKMGAEVDDEFQIKKTILCFVGPFKSMDVDLFVIEKLVLRDETWVDPRVNAGHSTKSGSTVRQVQRVAEVVTESSANSMVVWRMEEFTAVHIGFRKLILIGTGSNWRAQRGSHQSNNQQNNHRL